MRLLLVDGLNLVRRVHAAQKHAGEADRAHAAVQGSVLSLRRALADIQPSHAAAVFEGEGPTRRQRLDPAYKAGRAPMPEALGASLGAIQEAFASHLVRSLWVPGEEADDVIATIARKVAARAHEVVILSSDRAFHALVSAHIRVRDHFARSDLDAAAVRTRHGVPPEQLLDLWALAGFASSGVKGVPGVGPKHAARLLAEYGDLEAVLAAAAMLRSALGRALRAHAAEALRTRAFLELRVDLPIGVNLSELRVRNA